MHLKTSLHIHTKEDVSDGHAISYDVYGLIDRASELGFDVLGLTCHRKFVYKKEHGEYAQKKGITLIPGIELALNFFFRQNHVLVLNCDRSAEEIKSFAELSRYKKDNPHVFVIAPHPASASGILGSIGKRKLKKFIHIFDAVEHSWLYTRRFNQNRKAEKIARGRGLPFIATSDIHTMKYFNTDYLIVDSPDKEVASVFSAIRTGKYISCTRPKRVLSVFFMLSFFYLIYILKIPLKFYRQKNLSVTAHE
ncbi:MAG: PHP domain-containing protein [Patescibacteria group bacterium]|jgi:predicted metal-dependent phosphoesterase TrpH